MKLRSLFSIILPLFFFSPSCSYAQLNLPLEFASELYRLKIDLIEPLEASYKPVRIAKNDYLNCSYVIWSKKEQLEIRYAIAPYNENKTTDLFPDLKSFTMASNLATNDESAVITKLSVEKDRLQNDFRADWGTIFHFRPKPAFSDKEHCQMLALYKDEQAYAYVFFLFDDPNNEALDYRFYALRFLE